MVKIDAGDAIAIEHEAQAVADLAGLGFGEKVHLPALRACASSEPVALWHPRQERLEAERLPLILGGYSRGGLIATLVADLTSAAGSFALGFPFHSPGNTTEWRSAHLAAAIKPVLLLNGDQDPYGYPDELVDVPLAESVELHWLPDRNHGMTYASAVDRNPIDSIQEMAGQIVAFGQRLIADA